MASKGKSKLKKTEVKYLDQVIDLRRFAYDVFANIAATFAIPTNCFEKWEDLRNDYGTDILIPIVRKLCFRFQIPKRLKCYEKFESHYEPKKFSSLQGITGSLQLILRELLGNSLDIIDEVIISLSITSEFILYLYSKNCNLYPIELAKFWFRYLQPNKDKFEKAGGLAKLQRIGTRVEFHYVDGFYETFIPLHCIPYEKSVKNPKLTEIFDSLLDNYVNTKVKKLTPEEFRGLLKPEERKSRVFSEFLSINSMPQIFIRKESSEIETIENPGLGIRPHEELLRDIIADDKAPSQNLPGAHPQEPARRRRKESVKQKVKTSLREDDTSIDIAANTGLGIRPHEDMLRDFGASAAEASSQNLPVANPQELTRRRRRPSAQQKAKTSLREDDTSIDIAANTGLGIRPHECLLRDFGASAAEASSQNLPVANPQEQTGRRRRPSAQQRGASTSLEDHFKGLNLGSPGTAGSIVENPDVSTADDVTQLQNPSGEDPQGRKGACGQQRRRR